MMICEEHRQTEGTKVYPGQECPWCERDALLLRIGALKKALYAECVGSACANGDCCGGYRLCSGCDRRAKEAHGPGWGEYAEKQKCPYNHSDHKITGFLPIQNCPNCFRSKGKL